MGCLEEVSVGMPHGAAAGAALPRTLERTAPAQSQPGSEGGN